MRRLFYVVLLFLLLYFCCRLGENNKQRVVVDYIFGVFETSLASLLIGTVLFGVCIGMLSGGIHPLWSFKPPEHQGPGT